MAANLEVRVRELDGWRAISVLLVIAHHIFAFQHPGLAAKIPFAPHVLWNVGRLGVRTFFIISGFVICRLLIAEELRFGSVSLRGFYCRRVFRILPPLFLYLGATALLFANGIIRASWMSFANAAAFLGDIKLPASWFFAHTWSLAVEEQFYLIFPTIWILTSPRYRKLLFGCVFLLCIAWTLALSPSTQNPLLPDVTRSGFACICFGVLTAIHEQRFRIIAHRIHPLAAAVVALVLLAHPVPTQSTVGFLFDASLTPVGLSLILLYSLEHRSWLTAFLCSAPVQAVGLTSYGIYLWQQLFTAPAYDFLKPGPARFFPLLLPCLVIVVPLSYFCVEKPAMRYGKLLSKRIRSTLSSPATVGI